MNTQPSFSGSSHQEKVPIPDEAELVKLTTSELWELYQVTFSPNSQKRQPDRAGMLERLRQEASERNAAATGVQRKKPVIPENLNELSTEHLWSLYEATFSPLSQKDYFNRSIMIAHLHREASENKAEEKTDYRGKSTTELSTIFGERFQLESQKYFGDREAMIRLLEEHDSPKKNPKAWKK